MSIFDPSMMSAPQATTTPSRSSAPVIDGVTVVEDPSKGLGIVGEGVKQVQTVKKTHWFVKMALDSLGYSGAFLIAALACAAFDAEVAYTLAAAGGTILVSRIVIVSIGLAKETSGPMDSIREKLQEQRSKHPILSPIIHIALLAGVIGVGILFPYVGIGAGAIYAIYMSFAVDDATKVRDNTTYRSSDQKERTVLSNIRFGLGMTEQLLGSRVFSGPKRIVAAGN